MDTVIKINPRRQLKFETIAGASSTTLISLTAHQSLAFKIKTTAPQHYLVRPNHGVIQSGETREISVIMQPSALDDTL